METNELTSLIEAERKRFEAEIEAMSEKVAERVRDQLREEAKPKFQISPDVFAELLGRAAAINDAAKIKVADMVAEGKRAEEITAELLTLATTTRDAKDKGDGPGANGTGLDEKGDVPNAEIRSFKQIDDDTFYASLMNPASRMLN